MHNEVMIRLWMNLILLAVVLSGLSGAWGLLSTGGRAWGQWVASACMAVAGVMGAGAGLVALAENKTVVMQYPGVLPGMAMHLKLDALAAFFLVLVFVVGAASSIYGLGYWPQRRRRRTARKLQLVYGLMIAAMAMVTLAADAVVFLTAWEVMAVAGFFLISTEDERADTRQAGWVYLVATHVGTLSLFGVFALMHVATHSYELVAIPPADGAVVRLSIFLLALLGFGIKAGLMPLHFWLPGAHGNAPSHVSATLSGVLLKMGIYGLLRILMCLPQPPAAWGVVVLLLGASSAVLGVAFALGQHDIKRLLAYHSIENIGIILIGLGVALIGVADRHPMWVVLGMAGCLLHVWNHGLFKSLLFLGAGSVISATGSRKVDELGGLARRMPWTAGLFLLGAWAICGLPPLNGFISELLVYLGALEPATHAGVGAWAVISLAAVALAVAGALALACFVKAYGAVFLGMPRSRKALQASEVGRAMLGPMVVLGGMCLVIGLFPMVVLTPLEHAVGVWSRQMGSAERLATAVPWRMLSIAALALVAGVGLIWLVMRRTGAMRTRRAEPTWGCGYAQGTARMQYTASSLAQMLVGMLRWVLLPVQQGGATAGLFAESKRFHSEVPDLVTDRMLFRFWRWMQLRLRPMRRVQQGSIQRYLLYILLVLFGLLLTLVPVWTMVRRMLAL
ncbi:MAG: hydrogenase [Phycisphaerales bacterium]|nr:hydrogenase [Phycisphaerales bacterium]